MVYKEEWTALLFRLQRIHTEYLRNDSFKQRGTVVVSVPPLAQFIWPFELNLGNTKYKHQL